ncbi:type I-E CRISPR-associated protein Cse2/CasB [Streptomyces sp. NPDC048518]|uniref:type I-E CRISPR-associated protein Cse2/CasB n=1 Tax=Streptomyces sp. NPDC048518 TaxID=3155029 RepID=UPI0033D2F112
MTSTAAPPPTGKQKRIERCDAFVGYVLGLCRDKKAQADLRTGLGLPVERCHYLHRYLVPWLPPERLAVDVRRAHYAVAALIAGRPRSARDAHAAAAAAGPAAPAAQEWWKRPNLGGSLAHAVNKQALKPASAEGDLHLMTRQSSDAIHPRLPSLTRHLLTSSVTVDWAVLLEDLAWWNYDRDRIATRWLESYFRTRTFDDLDDEAKETN